MNGVVQSNSQYLNDKINMLSQNLSSNQIELSDCIVVGNNKLSQSESEITKNMNDSLVLLKTKIDSQLKQLKKADVSLQNIDKYLMEKSQSLENLDEVNVSQRLLSMSLKSNNLSKSTIQKNKESEFENIPNNVNKNTKVYDITSELGTKNTVYFGVEKGFLSSSYYGYVQLNDGDDAEQLVNNLKQYVCKLLIEEGGESLTSGCRKDIMNLSYTVEGDCIKLNLPSSFSTLIGAANLAGMDPLSMLTDDMLVKKGGK